MAGERTGIYGIKSVNCPVPSTPVPCYEPCEHRNFVHEQTLPLIGNPEFLAELIEAILTVNEQLIEAFCDIDICRRGEYLGFPCVQCDFVITPQQGTQSDQIDCNGDIYSVINPCVCTVGGDRCITGLVDFSTPGEPLDLYTNIIDLLTNYTHEANWTGIEAVAKILFGDNAKVVKFDNGTYYIDVGMISDFVRNALNILKKLFPVPIGSDIQFVLMPGIMLVNPGLHYKYWWSPNATPPGNGLASLDNVSDVFPTGFDQHVNGAPDLEGTFLPDCSGPCFSINDTDVQPDTTIAFVATDQLTFWGYIELTSDGIISDVNTNRWGEKAALWIANNDDPLVKIQERITPTTPISLGDTATFTPVPLTAGIYKVGMQINDANNAAAVLIQVSYDGGTTYENIPVYLDYMVNGLC